MFMIRLTTACFLILMMGCFVYAVYLAENGNNIEEITACMGLGAIFACVCLALATKDAERTERMAYEREEKKAINNRLDKYWPY